MVPQGTSAGCSSMGPPSSGGISRTEATGKVEAEVTSLCYTCVLMSSVVMAGGIETPFRKGNGFLVYLVKWYGLASPIV